MAKLPLVLVGCVAASIAHACPDGQSSTSFGVCLPNGGGGDVARAWQHGMDELRAQVVGNPLAEWILNSRNSAIANASAIPIHIRQQLDGFIDEDSLNKVRFKIGDSGILNAANVIENVNQAVAAVTLIDVIVFSSQDYANDPEIWAHELTHVSQYTRWGIRDFAIRYARNPDIAENEAYARQAEFVSWGGSNGPIVNLNHPCITPVGLCYLPTPSQGQYCSCAGRPMSPIPTYR